MKPFKMMSKLEGFQRCAQHSPRRADTARRARQAGRLVAVKRNNLAVRQVTHGPNPRRRKGLLKLSRIEAREHSCKRVMRREPIRQAQDGFEPDLSPSRAYR